MDLTFIQSLCTTKAAQDQLANQIVSTLNTDTLTPLRRYAIMKALAAATEQARQDIAAAAEVYCEQNNLGSDGKDFVHEDDVFRRQIRLSYAWADNDDLEDPGYTCTQLQNLIAQSGRQKKAYETQLAARRELVELEHPNMVPHVDRVTLMYQGTYIEVHEKAQNNA